MLGDKYTVKEITPIIIDKIKTELQKRLSYFQEMNTNNI